MTTTRRYTAMSLTRSGGPRTSARGIQPIRGIRGIQAIRGIRGVRGVRGIQAIRGIRGIRAMRGGVALFTLLAFLLLPLHASARDLARVENPWDRARTLYGEGEFNEARRLIIEAIQREPTRSELYLGLARTLFQLGEYDAAVYHYDLYLRSFPLPDDASREARQARDRAVTERGGANQERERPTEAPSADPRHEAAAARFLAQLESGPIVATREASAAELWEVLLRTGYVHPDLATKRERLRAAALEEAMRTLPHDALRMPALSQEEWDNQARRLRVAAELVPGVEDPNPGDQHARGRAALSTARGQQQMLRQNEAAALPLFRAAHEADPAFMPAVIGILNALVLDPELRDTATRDALLRRLAERQDDDARLLHPLYRAILGERGVDQGAANPLVDELIRRTP